MDDITIFTAAEAGKTQNTDITARAGMFSQEEIDSVPAIFGGSTGFE